jgi:Tfp pilus assembly protein PilO
MKRLPTAKRNQLIVVILVTVGLIGLVYFLLILPQNQENARIATLTSSEQTRLQQFKATIKQMDATAAALADLTNQLNRAEADVASGDLAAWTYDTVRRFKASYHVEIPNVGQPVQGDCDLIGNFPYKQIRFSLSGIAYYHDLGKFISEFENKFPHARVLNLQADPAGNGSTTGERLNFRMDVIALVKPNNN